MHAKQLVFLNVSVALIAAVSLIGGYIYFNDRANYVTENDAYVDLDAQMVTASVSGRVESWNVSEGQTVRANQVLGMERLPTGQMVRILTPIAGQILKSQTVDNEVVAPGTLLAAVGDLNREYVRANVQETKVRNVRVGQNVDIYVDAYPGTTFSGVVERIDAVSAAMTSPFPTSQSTANFTKEVQRVPVIISLAGNEGKYIIPRMNVRVRIHRTN